MLQRKIVLALLALWLCKLSGLTLAQGLSQDALIKPINGQFLSEGHPVDEFHCEPMVPGKHPVVLLIHGCAPEGFGDDEFKQMCVSLAEHGYYAMFVEYYSRTGQPNCAQFAMIETHDLSSAMPLPSAIWAREIVAAGTSLGKNGKVDSSRFGLVGFSSGALMALVEASFYPDVVRAVVDYYGFMTPRGKMFVGTPPVFPPTLILQGDADSRVSTGQSLAGQSSDVEALLVRHGDSHEFHVYPGVEHTFNFHEARGYDPDAAKDAWARTLTFLEAHLR